jgi:hypothetical protein
MNLSDLLEPSPAVPGAIFARGCPPGSGERRTFGLGLSFGVAGGRIVAALLLAGCRPPRAGPCLLRWRQWHDIESSPAIRQSRLDIDNYGLAVSSGTSWHHTGAHGPAAGVKVSVRGAGKMRVVTIRARIECISGHGPRPLPGLRRSPESPRSARTACLPR